VNVNPGVPGKEGEGVWFLAICGYANPLPNQLAHFLWKCRGKREPGTGGGRQASALAMPFCATRAEFAQVP
jgi:hypothetical protein